MVKRYGQTMRSLINICLVFSILLLASGIYYIFKNELIVGAIEAAVGFFVAVYFIIFSRKRKTSVNNYVRLLGKDNNPVSSNILMSFPIPMVVAHIDGSIRWYNGEFSELMDNVDMFEQMVEKIIP